jgi:hypothetical protein
MTKKTLLQLFLFLIIIIISLVFFKTYFTQKNLKISTDIKKNTLIQKKSNLIHNIEYISKDQMGNTYVIKSELAEIDESNPELILLKNVVAIIDLNNSTPIKVYSDNAIYNNINYDTNFYSNVVLTYAEHKITSENLDLIFNKNLATITNNITYKNLNAMLEADKIEIDLITKNSKISMNNKSDKINIISIN